MTFLGADSATHNELKGVATMKAILDANRDVYTANPALHAGLLLQIARTYQRSGNFAEAAPFLKQALALRTSPMKTAKLLVAQTFKLGPMWRKRTIQ